MTTLRDEAQNFSYQFGEDDSLLVQNGPKFLGYEERKVNSLEARIKSYISCINEMIKNSCKKALLQ